MSNNTNSSIDAVLSALSPETRSVLESHYRQQVISELSTKLSADVPSAKPVITSKRFINRQKTNDGTNRSASQYIRDLDELEPGLGASEVVVQAVSVGLDIEPSLVYNVRQNLKKKTGVTMATNPATADEIKAKRQAAAAKARKVKAEKKAARDAVVAEEVVADSVVADIVVEVSTQTVVVEEGVEELNVDSEVMEAVEELVQLEEQIALQVNEQAEVQVDEVVSAPVEVNDSTEKS